MVHRVLADGVLLVHLAFILFVLFGALLVAWRRALLPLHLAAAVYGVAIELTGAACPLTGLEVHLRLLAGQAGYEGGFVEHYLLPVIYPAGLSRHVQYWLAGVVLALNLALYAWLLRRRVPKGAARAP
jgi:hypothetical protein